MTLSSLPRREFLKVAAGAIGALGPATALTAGASASTKAIRLIVRGDDMGFSRSGN